MAEDIHDMAENNMLNKIRNDIENGTDLNKKNEFGWTPLHLAISREHEEMAILLLEHGADASVQDNDGLNALHYVAAMDHMYNVAKVIIEKAPETLHVENKYKEQPLWIAVHNARRPFDMIKLFLEKGANKNHGEEGQTAFDRARSYNTDDVAKLFDGY